MVRLNTTAIFFFAAASVNAFVPSRQSFGISHTAVFATKSGLNIPGVKKSIDGLTKENFSETLSTVEPFLLNDAGISIYSKSMRRIATKAKMLGVEVPTDYAKDAAATKKRRERQDAFIKQKEADAAEAAEAEAEEEAEEEAPAE